MRTSQYNPGHEVPEKNWLYRLAKRFWFNDFGVYRGHDHRQSAAPDPDPPGANFHQLGGLPLTSPIKSGR